MKTIKYTPEQMATWILDNWKTLLPILRECEQEEIDRHERIILFKEKMERFMYEAKRLKSQIT